MMCVKINLNLNFNRANVKLNNVKQLTKNSQGNNYPNIRYQRKEHLFQFIKIVLYTYQSGTAALAIL